MLPIVPALALTFLSFICSAFVILRIVIPILPPHPLSKRVSPAEFGLPTFQALSTGDKSHLWLASLDLVAISIFMWQVVSECTSGPSGYALATDPASAIRLWIVVTVRQSCLLMVSFITLLHVRMAHPVSFGGTQWMVWAPTVLLTITSTAVAGILAGSGVESLFYGLTAYSSAIALFTAIAFASLICTLFAIKRNLTAFDESSEPWPPVRKMEGKARPSFATEDIDALKDGASWITSDAGSHRQSFSGWSFSTHHTVTTTHGRPQSTNQPSISAKSALGFGPNAPGVIQVPPVPPLPSPYGPPVLTPDGLPDPDPFRRDIPSNYKEAKARLGSLASWLTESDASHHTLTSWSFPATHRGGSVPNSIAEFHTAKGSIRHSELNGVPRASDLSSAQVLGGYGFASGNTEAEKGMGSLLSIDGSMAEISVIPFLSWLVTIFLPFGLALPYLIIVSKQNLPSTAVQILFILSVTLSSPLLTLNLLTGSPLPIPVGLFDNDSLPEIPAIGGSFPPTRWSADYKRSTSTSATVVEGRRSGDVWISKGDAVDGKSKFGRAVTMLNPAPKLSVLPFEEDDGTDMPPIPFQNDDDNGVHMNGSPHSENNVQFGRLRAESRGSTLFGNVPDDSKIMVAQKHYSALAQTVVFQGLSADAAGDRNSAGASTLVGGTSSGVASKRGSYSSHLRTRSISSTKELRPPTLAEREKSISPPPSFPLPPTPPSVRAARLAMLSHKKSFSSGVSLYEVDDINEIDAMTAGVLPLLTPGLIIGDMRIKDGEYSPPATLSKTKGLATTKKLAEIGEDISSSEVHSKSRPPRGRKASGHKKNHYSLPSLGLGKEGISTWSQEIRGLEAMIGPLTSVPSNADLRRNTVMGVDSTGNAVVTHLEPVEEEENKPTAALSRNMSLRSLGLKADVPHDVNSACYSMDAAGPVEIPASANSEATLFEDFEAGIQSSRQAESTPHTTVTQKRVSRNPPPPIPVSEIRRPTIRYIKSDNTENGELKYPLHENETIPEEKPTAHWSTRIRSVVPKASKLSRSPSDASAKERGLRQLTLLQDRANVVNTNTSGRSSPTAEIRPLTIGKKDKSRLRPLQLPKGDENAIPGAVVPAARNKNIKGLTLTRSETTKARGILRQTETLPSVVVRPPSNSEHHGFGHAFND